MVEEVLELPEQFLSVYPQPAAETGSDVGRFTGFFQGVFRRFVMGSS
jgi:hypothetical protein